MNEALFAEAMQQLGAVTAIVAEYPAAMMLAALQRSETVALFTHPTLLQQYLADDNVRRYLIPQLNALAACSAELNSMRLRAVDEGLL